MQLLGLDAHQNHNQLSRNAPLAQLLAEEAEEYSARVLNGFYPPTNAVLSRPDLMICGIQVPKRLIRFNQTAFCSECWNEGREYFIRDINIAQYCPYHERRYLSHCPHCNARLPWPGPLHGECRCGHRLDSPPCSQDEAAPEKFLLTLFRSMDRPSLKKLIRHLRQLEYDFKHACRPHHNRQTIKGAIALCEHDANGVIQYLEYLESCYPGVPRDVLAAKLPKLRAPTIEKAIIKFIENSAYSKRGIIDNFPTLPFTLSKAQLCNLLKISMTTLNELLLHEEFPASQRGDARFQCPEIDVLIKLLTRKRQAPVPQDELPLLDAARLLGVPLSVCQDLIKAGLLAQQQSKNGPLTIAKSELFHFSENYFILNSLYPSVRTNITRLRKTLHRLCIPEVPIAARYTHLISSHHAAQLFVELEKMACPPLKATWRKHSATLEPFDYADSEPALTARKAATQLGLDLRLIKAFARLGVFTKLYKGENGKYMIPLEEIDKFQQRYILGREIAVLTQTSKNSIPAQLAALGISPLIQPQQRGSPIYLYAREDITPEIINALHASGLRRASPPRRLRSHEITRRELVAGAYTPVKELVTKYGIAHSTFSKLFLHRHYVDAIRSGGTHYLSPQDTKKVEEILDNYYTCGQIDKLLGTPHYAHNLIAAGKISADYPLPAEYTDIVLVHKSKITV